jgi:hypothetical protein
VNDSRSPVPLDLDDRKESAVRRLGAHFAEDHLTVEEFESSVDRVYSAASLREVEGVFEGLPTLRPDSMPQRGGQAALVRRARPEEVPERGLQVAIMSGAEKKGEWIPARRFTTIALMGGAGLDLREAQFGPGITEVRIVAVMGGVEVIVPPGLAVETHGIGIMGGFESFDQVSADPDPDAPRVIIRGVAIMGGVEVTARLPGESARDAKRRRRDERKALKGQR